MSSGDELLARLAERPFDRALRLVFSDWLLEQGDPRGEAIALGLSGELSLTQRRRLQRLTAQHAAQWLGPLVTVADVSACRWEGGFLDAFVAGPAPAEAWHEVVGDPRLATVRSVSFPVLPELPLAAGAAPALPDASAPLLAQARPTRPVAAAVLPFLAHPVLRHVTRLQATGELLEVLGGAPLGFAPEKLAVGSWGTFGAELAALSRGDAFPSVRRLELVTSEFINVIVAAEVRDAVLAHVPRLHRIEDVRLVARYGVVEGAAAWLNRGDEAARFDRQLAHVGRWEVDWSDVGFGLARGDGGRFGDLAIDLRGGADGASGLGQRVAAAASVLVLLGPARLHRVDVLLPPGARLRGAERDALRAAVRRLGTVTEFNLDAAPALP